MTALVVGETLPTATLESATVTDAEGTTSSLASHIKGRRTLILLLRHCL